MPDQLSRGTLFDPQLVTDLINKVKGRSSLAVLSSSQPIPFNGQKEFTFTLDSEIDVVAENGKKSHGGMSLEPLTILPIKVEYGARVSDEFIYASEEAKIDVLKSFNEGFARKVAKGIDLMAFHGINPRTKTKSDVIGQNNFTDKVTQTIEFADGDNPDEKIDDAVAVVQGAEGTVSGIAMAPTFSSKLAKVTVDAEGKGQKMYPELKWGANPGSLNGVKLDINNTVSAHGNHEVILGDFQNMFKWGYAKHIPMEIIKYGDPDNSGKDLKGYNQVYIRAEAYLGWGILDPKNFVRVVKQ